MGVYEETALNIGLFILRFYKKVQILRTSNRVKSKKGTYTFDRFFVFTDGLSLYLLISRRRPYLDTIIMSIEPNVVFF